MAPIIIIADIYTRIVYDVGRDEFTLSDRARETLEVEYRINATRRSTWRQDVKIRKAGPA